MIGCDLKHDPRGGPVGAPESSAEACSESGLPFHQQPHCLGVPVVHRSAGSGPVGAGPEPRVLGGGRTLSSLGWTHSVTSRSQGAVSTSTCHFSD